MVPACLMCCPVQVGEAGRLIGRYVGKSFLGWAERAAALCSRRKPFPLARRADLPNRTWRLQYLTLCNTYLVWFPAPAFFLPSLLAQLTSLPFPNSIRWTIILFLSPSRPEPCLDSSHPYFVESAGPILRPQPIRSAMPQSRRKRALGDRGSGWRGWRLLSRFGQKAADVAYL